MFRFSSTKFRFKYVGGRVSIQVKFRFSSGSDLMLAVWVRVKLMNRDEQGRAFALGRAGVIMAGDNTTMTKVQG